MPIPTKLLDHYQVRRNDLSEQLRQAKWAPAKEQLSLALLTTEITVATIHDIAVALKTIGAHSRAQADGHVQRIKSATSDLHTSLEQVNGASGSAFEVTLNLLGGIAELTADSAKQGVRLAGLQGELFGALGEMWLETLDELYFSPSREIIFEQISKLVEFAASKIPVVGDVFEGLKLAIDLFSIKIEKARTADEYFSSLESYLDAGVLYLQGVFSYCAHVDSIANNQPEPTKAQIEDRISKHIASVANRTHPTTVATQKA